MISGRVKPLIDGGEWKPVVGYEGSYEVSNQGEVRSLDRTELMSGRHPVPYLRRRRGKILSAHAGRGGYPAVMLSKEGRQKLCLVHRLVATAFLGAPDAGWEVNHKDGSRGNNSLDNLEWSNRKHNSLHSTRVLKKNRGQDSGTSKLTEAQVLEICRMLEEGLSQTEIATKFVVTIHAIHRIKHGYNWAWLTGYGKEVTNAQIS